jgi:hypothetical protein
MMNDDRGFGVQSTKRGAYLIVPLHYSDSIHGPSILHTNIFIALNVGTSRYWYAVQHYWTRHGF